MKLNCVEVAIRAATPADAVSFGETMILKKTNSVSIWGAPCLPGFGMSLP